MTTEDIRRCIVCSTLIAEHATDDLRRCKVELDRIEALSKIRRGIENERSQLIRRLT